MEPIGGGRSNKAYREAEYLGYNLKLRFDTEGGFIWKLDLGLALSEGGGGGTRNMATGGGGFCQGPLHWCDGRGIWTKEQEHIWFNFYCPPLELVRLFTGGWGAN